MSVQQGPEIAAGGVARSGDRILLVRRAHAPAAGRWAIPAGRVRFGEDVHDTVVREVAEETGLECVVRRFLGFAQHIDADYHQVILDFLVDVHDPGRAPAAGDDATEAQWWPVDTIDRLELAPGLREFLGDVGMLEP